jgi:hypothetical protein
MLRNELEMGLITITKLVGHVYCRTPGPAKSLRDI